MKTEQNNEESSKTKIGPISLSLFLHLILLTFIGGAVIIEQIVPKTQFNTVSTLGEQLDEALPSEEQTTEETPKPTVDSLEPVLEPDRPVNPSEPVIQAFTMDDSSSPSSFSMPAPALAVKPQTDAPATPSESAAPKKQMIRDMTTLFGSKGESSDALVGYMYDLKQTKERKPTDMEDDGKDATAYLRVMKGFARNWDVNEFSKYYQTKKPLSTYQIFMPIMSAYEAPKAFDVEKDIKPRRWAIHYKGKFVAPRTGIFRFVGSGDDVMMVRFDQKTVLDAGITPIDDTAPRQHTKQKVTLKGPGWEMFAGSWIKVEAGESYPMEVLVGEIPGGEFFAFLMIEEKGVNYEKQAGGQGVKFPVFQMVPTKMPKYDEEKAGPGVALEAFVGKS